jgi:hypothetical protein
MSDLTALFEFLSSPNPAARQIALDNLIGHTVKADPQRHLFIPSLGAPLYVEAAGEGDEAVQAKASGSGLGAGQRAEEDRVKVAMLRDLSMLCRDQAVCSFNISIDLWQAGPPAGHETELQSAGGSVASTAQIVTLGRCLPRSGSLTRICLSRPAVPHQAVLASRLCRWDIARYAQEHKSSADTHYSR